VPYREGKKWRATPKFRNVRGTTKICGTKKEAIEWERAEKERMKEIFSRKQKGLVLLGLTVKYLNYAQIHSQKTYQEKHSCCKKFLKELDNNILVEDITPEMALNYLLKQKKKRSGNAANKDRKNLLRMFNYGISFLELRDNPFAKTEKFPHDREPQYTPPIEDVLRLLAVCTRVERIFLDAFLQTGCRRSEAFRWTWHEDINFERKQVRVGTRKTRDGSMQYRWLDMSDELYESLWWLWVNRGKNPKLKPGQNKIIKRSPFVFVNDHPSQHFGQPYSYRQRFMKRLCERAKIKPFGFHALRRFVASLLDDHKVPLTIIQRVLGHSKPSTTDRYLTNLRGDIGMKETMNLLSIEGKKPQKNKKVHINGTHPKTKKA